MDIKTIINGNIVASDKIINNAIVVIEDGRIAVCGPREQFSNQIKGEIIDAEGRYLVPGFIDIHCHGGGGYYFHEDPDKAAVMHLSHGTTSLFPTVLLMQKKETLEAVKCIAKCENPIFAGIHMEGPYLNSKYGAIKELSRLPDEDEYEQILKIAGDKVKLWTLAPELEKTDEFIDAISGRGIVLSVGHSEALPERIFELIPKGLRLGCHCLNATGVMPVPLSGIREVGVDEAVMVNDDIYAEVIPDSEGVHVRPLMLKLLLKAKGVNKTIIITDAIKYAGINEPGNSSDVYYNELGRLCGSKLTMDLAIANTMKNAGIGLVEAIRMATLIPAILFGMDKEVGSIDIGKRANIVIVTKDIMVKQVMLDGSLVS